jgi:putative hydrolase of the HAD superfamily
MHPRALLLDLDDTILDDSGLVPECWRAACVSHAGRLAPLDAEAVMDAIRSMSRWYWGDAERHRAGRLDLDAARREVVGLALADMGIRDAELATAIGDAYSRSRDIGMEPLPQALDTVRWLRESGRRLGLVTNGAGPAQRRKIVRFGLAELFDVILVEGELGFGKPDARVYRHAIEALRVGPSETWMVGDNLEWDVIAPQRLGLSGVWIDLPGRGVPPGASTRPDHVLRSLSEIRSLLGNDPPSGVVR